MTTKQAPQAAPQFAGADHDDERDMLLDGARRRMGAGAALREAVRCVCTGCGAHSYRAIGYLGRGRGRCSVCLCDGLEPLGMTRFPRRPTEVSGSSRARPTNG